MPPDELIPSNRDQLSRQSDGVNPITSQMARDLLVRGKEKDELTESKTELPEEAEVRFKCPNLEIAIREELEKPEGPVTRNDMAILHTFVALRKDITDLSGLENAFALTELTMELNPITDISPLANLTNLIKLEIRGSLITDLAPLADLVQLKALVLNCNALTDLAPIANLVKLSLLGLGDNEIWDLSPLANLLKLSMVSLEGTLVTEFSGLAHLPELKWLFLRKDQILDLLPPDATISLTEPWLWRNPIPEELEALLKKALPDCLIYLSPDPPW